MIYQKWAAQPSIFCDLFQRWDAVVYIFLSMMCMYIETFHVSVIASNATMVVCGILFCGIHPVVFFIHDVYVDWNVPPCVSYSPKCYTCNPKRDRPSTTIQSESLPYPNSGKSITLQTSKFGCAQFGKIYVDFVSLTGWLVYIQNRCGVHTTK